MEAIEKAEVFLNKYYHELNAITLYLSKIKITETLVYMNTVNGNVSEVIALENDVILLMNSNISKGYSPNLLNLTYGIAWAFFLNGEYGKTLHYLNKILLKYEEGYRDDLYTACRLLSLLTHYELKIITT